MPDKLADHRQRVSFAEDISVVEALQEIANREGKTKTDVISEALRLLIQKKNKNVKSPSK